MTEISLHSEDPPPFSQDAEVIPLFPGVQEIKRVNEVMPGIPLEANLSIMSLARLPQIAAVREGAQASARRIRVQYLMLCSALEQRVRGGAGHPSMVRTRARIQDIQNVRAVRARYAKKHE